MYQSVRVGTNRYKSILAVQVSTDRYKPILVVRIDTKSETEQKRTNFVKLLKRNVPTDTETDLITLIPSPCRRYR